MSVIKIGWAKRDISTTEPVSIPGQMYMRLSEGIMDPLTVTALVLDGGEGYDAAIFVSCDIISIRDEFVAIVREKVGARDATIPLSNILIGATHTHTGIAAWETPETTPDGKPVYSGIKYRDFATDQIADAVCEAWAGRKEGGIAYGYGFAVVGHSRRTVYLKDQSTGLISGAPDGFGKMYGNTRKDDFSHYEAGADHFLNAMFTVDAAGKLTGMVVNVPCPSQTTEYYTKISADYWNEVRQEVAKEFGPDVFVLPQCAAAGDLAPRQLHYKEAQARRAELKYGLKYPINPIQISEKLNWSMNMRYDIAQQIITGLKDIYSWAMKDIQTQVPVRHVARRVPLSRRPITQEERAKCEWELEELKRTEPDPAAMTAEEYRVAMSQNQSYANRRRGVLRRYEEIKTEPAISYEIHVTQVGDIAFASNPFELYMDFMHRMQARSPFVQTFIVQLSGGRGMYLPTERGNANKGYSASMFCNPVGFQGGQELVEYTLGVLNEFAQQE